MSLTYFCKRLQPFTAIDNRLQPFTIAYKRYSRLRSSALQLSAQRHGQRHSLRRLQSFSNQRHRQRLSPSLEIAHVASSSATLENACEGL